MTKSAPIKFGIVGLGAISGAHIRALKELGSLTQIVAVADIQADLADRVASEVGCLSFGSLEAMIAQTDLDAVCICTPPNTHADLAVTAMKAGLHTLIEKPADVNVAATDRIIATSGETGCKASVISQHRFDPSSIAIRRAVEDGRFGRLARGAAQVRWWRPQEYFEVVPWRGSLEVSGGGALISQSIHTLDLLLWCLGEVEETMAYQDLLAHERLQVEDSLVAILKFRSGALGVVEASISAYPGLSARLELSGDRGSAIIDSDQLTYFHTALDAEQTGLYGAFGDTNRADQELSDLAKLNAGDYSRLPNFGISHGTLVPTLPSLSRNDVSEQISRGAQDPGQLSSAHQEQIRDFAWAILDDRAPAVTLDDSRYTMQVIEAIHVSAASGQPVRIERRKP